VIKNPNNPASGYTPFYKLTYDGVSNTTSQYSFNDYAGYIQDAWRPAARVSITGGLRIDKVKRFDDLFHLQTQNSTELGPRVGVNYILTSDEHNAVRASFMRVADAPSINQLLFAFGTNTLGFTEQYAQP
jgi:outer membrane receptor protein involved in Fe transport